MAASKRMAFLCVVCGYAISHAVRPGAAREPLRGDAIVCANCGAPYVLDGDLHGVPVTPALWGALSPALQSQIAGLSHVAAARRAAEGDLASAADGGHA